MKMPFLLISPKIVPKIQLIKKGGCFEYHAVIADKIKYRYVHRASICPALGMDRRSFFMPKPMGKYKRLEVFYLSKPVYTADKPSDCHYCYFWTNGRKGCRLGRNNCYYLISLPPKPKSECDGCPYGRDHPCIGYILLDCMPSLGMLTVNALAAADNVLIPVQAAYLPAKGLEQLLGTINKVKRQINPKLRIEGILLTMVDSRTNYSKDISNLIRESYGGKLKVYKTDIPRSVRAEEISAEGTSIFKHDPKGKVAEAYKILTKEVLNNAEKRRKHQLEGVR